MRNFGTIICLLIILMLAAPAVNASDDCGSISGTISIFKTKVKTGGPKGSGDVIVFLESVGENEFPAPEEHARLDQKGLIFIPHVLAILKGTTVDFLNNDNDKHNVNMLASAGDAVNLGTWQPGEERSHTFDVAEKITLLCKLHLEMAAYIVVLDNPYFTTAKIDGETQQASFTIENIPPGTYTVNTWHKKLKLKGGGQTVIIGPGEEVKLDLSITKAKYAK